GGIDGFLELTDQRKLPGEHVKLPCRSIEELFEAIRTLAVRGAPAIGVAAAYGLVLGMQKLTDSTNAQDGLSALAQSGDYLCSSRPTAVNLSWAVDRIQHKAEELVVTQPAISLQALGEFVLGEANAIFEEDVAMCRRIGEHGQKFIKEGDGILTHCNAGALATAGQGTALSVMFEAKKRGKGFKVYVDETRPLLQGARLTTWELKQAGIDVTLVCDNMAGWLMKQGKIDGVITGADRIAANADTPLYVAAPSSTFDLSIESGEQIPIEVRAAQEVTMFAGTQVAPDGTNVYNPAFDVTEAALIAAIITENGVIERPNADSIAEFLKNRQDAIRSVEESQGRHPGNCRKSRPAGESSPNA
ncbi:MAG: S-methyl-5-thioribose-1-phosphate isomerase, partial [Planctomycetota bacterium]